MAIRICHECSGKCTTTRDDCPHCGYIFPKYKICPECESEVDEKVSECPICGFYFVKKEEEPKEEKTKVEGLTPVPLVEEETNNIICQSCGSNDCEKLDEFTYKCRNCSSIINLKRPDVHVHNINNFAGDASTEDVPVYQIVKNLSEKEFLRAAIISLAKNKSVSPQILENLKVDGSMVKTSYITYVEKEYSLDLSYSCEIGTDRKEKYFENGQEKTRTVTDWKPFSGSASDGGTTYMCAFGRETQVDIILPVFIPSSTYGYEEFKESDRFPLKRRVDKSSEEREKSGLLSSLATSCKMDLPGDHNRSFNYNGRCTFGNTRAFYYVPSYSLAVKVNEKPVGYAGVANQKAEIYGVVDNDYSFSDEEENCPTLDDAKRVFKKTSFGVISLICLIVFPIIMGVSFIFLGLTGFTVLHMLIPFVIALGSLIAVVIVRNKTINKIIDGLISDFTGKKLEACKKCLRNNNLEPLTEVEGWDIHHE